MRRVLLLSLSVVSALAGVFLLVLALDVHRWQEQVVADDASFRAFPLTEDVWQPSTILPASLVSSTAGAGDDMRYRDGVRAFFLARPRARGCSRCPSWRRRAGSADRAHRAVPARAGSAAPRAHRHALGALAAVSPQQDVEQRVTTLEAAIAYLQETMRLDPTNEDAKFTESALRRMRAEPPNFEAARGGRRARDDESVAGCATSAAATDERLVPQSGGGARGARCSAAAGAAAPRRAAHAKVRAVLRLDPPARTQRGCSSRASSRCRRSSGSAPCSRSSTAAPSTSRAPTPRSSS